jgi:hypothetical protein
MKVSNIHCALYIHPGEKTTHSVHRLIEGLVTYSRCTLCTIHCTVHCVFNLQSSLPEDQSYCSAVILTVGLATCSCIVYSTVVIPRGPFQIAHQAFYLKIQCYSTANLDVIVTLCVKRVYEYISMYKLYIV